MLDFQIIRILPATETRTNASLEILFRSIVVNFTQAGYCSSTFCH